MKKNKTDYKWIIKIVIIAFIISFLFSFISEATIPKVNTIVGIIITLIFIVIGVLFDMIGVAASAANEQPFHSMNSRKVFGAKTAVIFKKNADKVSSFCNDVIGDICGIVSGSAGVIIANNISNSLGISYFYTTLGITSLIAALTIGGKAMGKRLAITRSNEILFGFAKFVSVIYKTK